MQIYWIKQTNKKNSPQKIKNKIQQKMQVCSSNIGITQIITIIHKNHPNFTLTFYNQKKVQGIDIKRRIQREKGYSNSDQTIIYNGKLLQDYDYLTVPVGLYHCNFTNTDTVTLITSGCGDFPSIFPLTSMTIEVNMQGGTKNLTASPNLTVHQLKERLLSNMNLIINGVDISKSKYKNRKLYSFGINSNYHILQAGLKNGCFVPSPPEVIIPMPMPVPAPGNVIVTAPVIHQQDAGIDVYSNNTVTTSAPMFPPNPTIPQNAPTNTVVIGSNQGAIYESQNTAASLNYPVEESTMVEEVDQNAQQVGNQIFEEIDVDEEDDEPVIKAKSSSVTRIAIEESDCNFKSTYFYKGGEKIEGLLKKWKESRGIENDEEYAYEFYCKGEKLDFEKSLNDHEIGSGDVIEVKKIANEDEWNNI